MAAGTITTGVVPVIYGGTGEKTVNGMAGVIGIKHFTLAFNDTYTFTSAGYLSLIYAHRGTNYWLGTVNIWGEVHIIQASENDLFTITASNPGSIANTVYSVKNNKNTGSLPVVVISAPISYS